MYINDNIRTVNHVHKKWVKILTVITYIISVSLVGLVIGLYYKLAWAPKYDVPGGNELLTNSSLLSSGNGNYVINFSELGVLNIKQLVRRNEV
jgi:hypothetical protein